MLNSDHRYQRRIILSLLLFLVAGAIVTVWDYQISLQTVMDQAEGYARRVAGFLSRSLAEGSSGNLYALLEDAEAIKNHAEHIDSILVAFDLLNVKIYDRNRIITYSLSDDVIGQRTDENESLTNALAGRSTSHVATPRYQQRTYGAGSVFPMLETYVPIREPGTGRIVGAYEIYQDYRPFRKEVLREMTMSSLTHLFLLAVVSLLLFRFGSYSARLLEEDHLRTIEDLEDRVGERTAELNRSRERINDLLMKKDRMFRDLMVSDEYKKNFMGLVSHEMRTPLTVIKGYLNLLQEGVIGPDSDDYEEIMASSITEARSLEAIINNILDLSQLDRGLFDLSYDVCDVEDIFREVLRSQAREIEEAGLKVDVEVDPEASNLHSDRLKVMQVVSQFLSNAVKFSSAGGNITLTSSPGLRGHLLSVKDEGVGIPESKADAIFKMFDQADISLTRSFEGTGLGLAIVLKISRLLSGRVWVESTEGAGSTFFFEVPDLENVIDLPDAVNGTDGIAEMVMQQGRKADQGKQTILIVDNDRDYLEMLRKLLLLEGFEVQLCNTGLDALNIIYGQSGGPLPSLVLLDMRMPDIHGLELTRVIRSNVYTRDIPVIIVSAVASSESMEDGLAAGANAYLTKPFDIDELLRRVSFLLESGSDKASEA